MRRRARLLTSTVAFLSALTAIAVAQDKEGVDCTEGGRTQLEMNACAQRSAEESAATLARLLDELRDTFESASWGELQELHAQWQTLSENECAWQRGLFGRGSVAPMVYAYCIKSRTDERIAWLKIFLCEGAEMTGPCDASRKYDRP